MSLERNIKEEEFNKKIKDEIENFQRVLSEKIPFALPNFLDKLSTLEIVLTYNIEGKYEPEYFTIQDLNRLIVNIPIIFKGNEYEITPEFRK